MGQLSQREIDILIIIERTTASISVMGTLALFGTFIFFKSFRTLSNTIIFYASFANLFANVAALIGGSALSQVNSPLCQFQGFLLEMYDISLSSFYSTVTDEAKGSCKAIRGGV